MFICRYGKNGGLLGGGVKSQKPITNLFGKSTTNLANSNKKSGPLNSKLEDVALKSSTLKRNAYTVDDLQPITISESVININNAISNIIVLKLNFFLNEQYKDLKY